MRQQAIGQQLELMPLHITNSIFWTVFHRYVTTTATARTTPAARMWWGAGVYWSRFQPPPPPTPQDVRRTCTCLGKTGHCVDRCVPEYIRTLLPGFGKKNN